MNFYPHVLGSARHQLCQVPGASHGLSSGPPWPETVWKVEAVEQGVREMRRQIDRQTGVGGKVEQKPRTRPCSRKHSFTTMST